MKNTIRRIGFRILFGMGLKSERLFNARRVRKELKNQPILIQEYELNRIAVFVKEANRHAYYNNLLKEFVTHWNIKPEKMEFIGRGIGQSSLNVYRKVRFDDQTYFEKVYFNSYSDLNRTLYFQKELYPLLVGSIQIPKIIWFFRGDLITVVYTSFEENKPLLPEKEEQALISVSKTLYQVSIQHQALIKQLNLPEILSDHTAHFEYKMSIARAKKQMKKHGLDFDYFEDKAKNSPSVITHGDLHAENIFADNTVIDWDSVGLYPIGLEQAFLFERLPIKKIKSYRPEEWLIRHFFRLIRPEDIEDFTRNFYYFLFIFSANHKVYYHLENQLVSQLKLYQYKNMKSTLTN